MSEHEIAAEILYRLEERLGILTDGRREPTPEEVRAARTEAETAANAAS